MLILRKKKQQATKKHAKLPSMQKVTVKLVWNGHSKMDITMILMTNGSLMKVKSIAECAPWGILQYFWPALSDNLSWKPSFWEWPFYTGFTNGSLMKVKSIAECSPWGILQYLWPALSNNLSWKPSFWEWPFYTGFTNGSLMKVKSIAECSPWGHSAILLTCIKR